MTYISLFNHFQLKRRLVPPVERKHYDSLLPHLWFLFLYLTFQAELGAYLAQLHVGCDLPAAVAGELLPHIVPTPVVLNNLRTYQTLLLMKLLDIKDVLMSAVTVGGVD